MAVNFQGMSTVSCCRMLISFKEWLKNPASFNFKASWKLLGSQTLSIQVLEKLQAAFKSPLAYYCDFLSICHFFPCIRIHLVSWYFTWIYSVKSIRSNALYVQRSLEKIQKEQIPSGLWIQAFAVHCLFQQQPFVKTLKNLFNFKILTKK